MKMKTLIISATSCVSLLAGCAHQTARNDMLPTQPTMVTQARGENPQAWYDLGCYYQGQERHALAASALERAVAADDTFVEAHNRLGVSYAMLGRHEEAIRQLEAAIKAAPGAAHLYSNLGYAHYLQGNDSEAAVALRHAIALDPANRRAQHNLGLVYARMGDEAKARVAFASAKPQPAATAMPATALEKNDNRIVQVAPNVYELRPRPVASVAAVPLERPSARHARVEVSNGNGVNGMARRVGSYLKDSGFAATRLTNQQGFGVTVTRVEYRNGYESEARQIAAAMPGSVTVASGANLRRDISVRLVLGRDMTGSLGYFEKNTRAARLAQYDRR